MGQIKQGMISFISKADIKALVASLARQIETDYEGREVVLICPLRGSIHFVADLARELQLLQAIDFVHVSPHRKGGTIHIHKDVEIELKDRHVLIVEEIIDTGRTLNFLKNRLLSASPASLKIVTLLDKPARREIPLKPDYTGKTIDDRYVVGYGMDSEELGRNYSDIYHLKN